MTSLDNIASLWYFLPESFLILVFVLIFLLDLPKRFEEKKWLLPLVSAVGLVFSILLTLYGWNFPKSRVFFGMITIDPFTNFFRLFCSATSLFAIYLSIRSSELKNTTAEYWGMLIGVTIGMSVLAASSNLLMIYLALELVSILSYIMVGYLPGSRRSAEAALKYVLYGATVSGIMIFGLSLIFGVTGSLDPAQIRLFLQQNPAERLTLFVGLLMAFAGFGYKISAVPFHMWAPDVYQGAPTPVTAFLSVGPKAAGFAILLRFIYSALTQYQDGVFIPLKFIDIATLMGVFAVATMTLGNLVAIQQTNIKRFLAYSSIAHAGYMLMGVASLNIEGIRGVMFYLLTYFIMNLGAFGVAIYVLNELNTENIEDYKGLSKRPGKGMLVALAMALFLFSLTGIPPTVGFVGKFYLFTAVIKAKLYWLALFGVANSVVSLYYYVRIVKYMFFDNPAEDRALAQNVGFVRVLTGLAVATILFGIFWKSLAMLTLSSADLLL